MQISGFIKQSLMDYPDKIAAVVFTQGCNFNCPYCHNTELMEMRIGSISETEIFTHLEKNRSLLDGVVISGGEPTVQKNLIPFLQRIKQLELSIKLDTNGSNPQIIYQLLENKLIDYIAMDIKAPLTAHHYSVCAGIEVSPNLLAKLSQSMEIIQNSGIPYEFRTTVAKELLQTSDIKLIGNNIQDEKRYYIQQVVHSNFNSYLKRDLEELMIGQVR